MPEMQRPTTAAHRMPPGPGFADADGGRGAAPFWQAAVLVARVAAGVDEQAASPAVTHTAPTKSDTLRNMWRLVTGNEYRIRA
jgi:hypothetical protein